MRLASLLTSSGALLVLQQIVSLWFLTDFFLARDSATVDRLFSERLSTRTTKELIQKLEIATSNIDSLTCNKTLHEQPTFDKIVLIVIDAFGAEFLPSLEQVGGNQVGSYKMPFLEQALKRKKAMGFIARAASPTVTMPRVKALVSGNIPSFMDIVYNLASDVSDFHDDNLLRLAKARGKSLVFYGDDTWLSLFDRSMFKRSRETLSMFASDYTSVDTNVTEMALPETKRDPLDWDYLILHYLGLDHIGHVFGSNEMPLIDKKLIEMDDVLEEIHTDLSKKSQRTLIIVCGDHGMSREGNHGGDSKLETETAMIFLPINSEFNEQLSWSNSEQVLQIDLAATLSLLTGLPIPRMSRGVVIKRLLESLWTDDEARSACAIIKNLMQLVRLLDEAELSSPDGLGNRMLALLNQSARFKDDGSASNKLDREQYYELARDIQAHLLRTVAAKSNPLLVMTAVTLVMMLSLRNLYRASIRLLMPLMATSEKAVCGLSVLLPILMLGSTNYIEFESTWWALIAICMVGAFCVTAVFLNERHSIKQDLETFRAILLIVSLTLAAMWNNSSLHRTLDFGWSLPMISVLIMCNHSRSTSDLDRKSSSVIFYTIGLCVFVTKVVEETSEREADHISKIASLQLISFIFLCAALAINLFMAFRKGDTQATSVVQKLATSWMWLVFLLSRLRNYPFLVANVMLEASLNSISNSLKLSPIARALMYLNLSTFAFYAQGNSNLFSTLDVKPGFFAQTSYNIWWAVPLIASATCGSQIFWYLKLFQRVQGEKEQERMTQSATIAKRGPIITPASPAPQLMAAGTREAIKDFIDMRNFLGLAYFMFVCTVLRNHLFIWSVISPKLVYLYVTNTILRLTTATISVLPQLLIKLFAGGSSLSRRHKGNMN